MRQNSYSGGYVPLRVGEYAADGHIRVPGELSERRYNLLLGSVLVWGFFINFLLCFFFGDAIARMNPFAILVIYLVSAVVGILLNTRSGNPLVSFIGYNLVVLPIGLVLSVYVSAFDELSVTLSFLITAIVTLTMMLLSIAFPQLFYSIGPALGVTLLVVLVFDIVLTLIGGFFALGVIDWIVTFIFCGYIGYDYAIAQNREKTADGAIDSACALYLDIVNLFIRVLAIVGRSRER